MYRNLGHSLGRAAGVLAVLFALTGALSAGTLTADCSNLPADHYAHVFVTWLDANDRTIPVTEVNNVECNTTPSPDVIPVIGVTTTVQPADATRFALDIFVFTSPTGEAGFLLKDCHSVIRIRNGSVDSGKNCHIPGGYFGAGSVLTPLAR